MKPTTWHRFITDEEGESVEQFIECDEDGNLTGFEQYADGSKSATVELGTRTLPLGFTTTEHFGLVEVNK